MEARACPDRRAGIFPTFPFPDKLAGMVLQARRPRGGAPGSPAAGGQDGSPTLPGGRSDLTRPATRWIGEAERPRFAWTMASAVAAAWGFSSWETFLLGTVVPPHPSSPLDLPTLLAIALAAAGLWTFPALLLGGLEALLVWPLAGLLARVRRHLARAASWRPVAAGLLLGASCALQLLLMARPPSSEPAAGWAPGIGLLLCWQAALTLLRPARRLAREPATSRWPAMILALLVPLAALALLSLHPPLRGPLAYRTVLAQVPWRLLLELDDMDGDGYPGLLGGDCAPWDETRHPAAEDLPGNGLDEDCLGGDAALRPRQQVVASSLTGRFLGRNLVLVTIGNLGAAQLSGNGSPRLITPAIDLLVSRGILLSRAWAQSTSCSASLASLLKGRYPRQLALSPAAVAPDATVHPLRQGEQAPPGTRVVWNAPLHDTSTSLAGHLADHDRLTLAVAAAVEQAPGTGLLHGFAQVDATPLSEAGTEAGKPVVDDRAVQAALGLLDEVRGRTFFLWVHLPDAEPPHLLHGGTPYHGDAPASRYDGEVAFADAQLGRLLGRMDQQGLLASTLVVVTADHGPALAAQPPGLLADQLHVPLLFLLPGEEARSIPAFVENVDVLPTVLELLGLPAPPGLAGQSLVPLFDGVRTERLRPEVVAELRTAGRSLRTLLSGDRQLLLDERLGLATLLPVRHGQGGPSEPEPEVALLEQLLQRLAQWDRRGPPPPTEPVQ